MENYGEDVAESILKTDQAKNEGQEGYISYGSEGNI
jgi:hypothetical protein